MKFFSIQKKIKQIPEIHDREIGDRVFRDWTLVVAVFSLLVLAVIVVDGYLLIRINRGDFFAPNTTTTLDPEILNRKTLLDVSGFFSARQKEYEAFRATASREIDPSI